MKQYIVYLLCLFVSISYTQQHDDSMMHPLCVYMVNKYCLNQDTLDNLNALNVINSNTFLRDCLTHAGLRECITQLHNPDKRDHAKKILLDVQTYFKKHLLYVNNYQQIRDKDVRYWATLSGISLLIPFVLLPSWNSNSPAANTGVRWTLASLFITYCSFIKWICTQTTPIDVYKINIEKMCLDIDELITT